MATLQKQRRLQFDKVIARGENPKTPDGFLAQTVNGTALAGTRRPGWNKDWDWGDRPQVEPIGPWSGNRTGE